MVVSHGVVRGLATRPGSDPSRDGALCVGRVGCNNTRARVVVGATVRGRIADLAYTPSPSSIDEDLQSCGRSQLLARLKFL